MTRPLALAAIVWIGAFAPAASAERYELKPVEGGFLRLDRDSGLTSFCKPSGDGYACRPTAEGASPDAAMIAALEKRVAELEAKVKALSGDPAKPSASRDPTLDLPSDEQVDRIASFLERALKRLKQIAGEAEKDEQRL